MPNHCGNCHRCEQACPTQALRDGCCDARRCLSFWTIESKSPTPPEIAAQQGKRIYGCDACQEACPWNRPRSGLQPRIDPHLLMPARLAQADTAELKQLDENSFEELFTGSPIRRIGVEHLRQNLEHTNCYFEQHRTDTGHT